MESVNPENDPRKNRLHIAVIAATTIATILISLYCLLSGLFIIFQNLFYIPIMLSCMYYTMRGFIYSVCLAVLYLLMVLVFTSESVIIMQALVRVVLFIGIAGVVTFLSIQRKRSEEALNRSEAIHRFLFENAIEGIFQTTPEGRFISANPAQAKIFGYGSPQELMEQITDIGRQHYVNPQERETYKNTLEAEGVIKGFEVQLLKKDGNPVWASISAQAVRDNEGAVIYQGTSIDITDRKQAEKLLLNERKKLLTLSENAPFGIVLIDTKGDFIYINPKFKELFGYDIEDVPDGRTWFKKAYPDPEYRKTVISTWVEDLKWAKAGQKRPRTFKTNCKDGTEKVINFVPVRIETGEDMIT